MIYIGGARVAPPSFSSVPAFQIRFTLSPPENRTQENEPYER
jgi:hypothetical protein